MEATHPILRAIPTDTVPGGADTYTRAEILRPLARKVGLPIVNSARPDQFPCYEAGFGWDSIKPIADSVDIDKLASFAVSEGWDVTAVKEDMELMLAGQPIAPGRGKNERARNVQTARVSYLLTTIAHLCERSHVPTFGQYCAMTALSHSFR